MRYELEMKTLSASINGERKEEERRGKERAEVHLPCRITADGRVAVQRRYRKALLERCHGIGNRASSGKGEIIVE